MALGCPILNHGSQVKSPGQACSPGLAEPEHTEEEARVIAVSVLYPRPQWMLMLQRRNMLGVPYTLEIENSLLTGAFLHLVLSACSNFCLFS